MKENLVDDLKDFRFQSPWKSLGSHFQIFSNDVKIGISFIKKMQVMH
jgi:hypothetical protein